MQSRTATNIIEDIEKLNIDDVFKDRLNEYINERDNIKQRKQTLNASINDYNNKLNDYSKLDKRSKAARELKQSLPIQYQSINNESQSINDDIELLRANLELLHDEIINFNDNKHENETFEEQLKSIEKESKKPLKHHVKPIKPTNIKETLQKKKQRIQKKIKKYIKKVHDLIPKQPEEHEEPQGNISDIQTFNPDENTLNIYFKRGSKKLFKDVKNIIIDQINKFKGVKAVFMQMF